MTSLPAARLKLKDRGMIRKGFKADIVLFDPLRVIDRATFQQPQLVSEGVKSVFVNGVEVWRDGASTGNRPGLAIRKNR
jgi:N-acyl-D-aspartate/D-glutamate deacylase